MDFNLCVNGPPLVHPRLRVTTIQDSLSSAQQSGKGALPGEHKGGFGSAPPPLSLPPPAQPEPLSREAPWTIKILGTLPLGSWEVTENH